METKDLIANLREWHENLISELCADDVLTCDDLCGYPGPCIVIQAANLLEAQQKRIAELEAALRTQQEERERPKPLTLDELRQMAQRCEGVYVAHVDGLPVFRGKRYCAAVLDFSPAFGSNTLHVHAIYGDRLTLWEDDYGKTWLAYRSKPKEDA